MRGYGTDYDTLKTFKVHCAYIYRCTHDCANTKDLVKICDFFSSAVPPGSGAFQMPTCPSSSASAASASASTLRGEGPISETLQ